MQVWSGSPFSQAWGRARRTGPSPAGWWIPEPSHPFPAYHSLNVRLNRRFVFSGSVLTGYVALWNAYGRENISSYYWNQVDNRRDTFHQWGFLPVFGLEWKF